MGFEVGGELLEVPAETLPQPELLYGNNYLTVPQLGHWNLQTSRNADGTYKVARFAQITSVRNFHMLAMPGSLGDLTAEEIHAALVKQLSAHGIVIKKNEMEAVDTEELLKRARDAGMEIPSNCDNQWYLKRFFNTILTNQDDCGIIVIPEKDYEFYAFAKRLADFNSRHLLFAIGSKFLRKGQFDGQFMSNLALKVNMKFGGDNHHLGLADLNEVLDEKIRSNTIVLGADIGHTGPGGRLGSPSIACVVGSVNNHLMAYPGSMRLQMAGQEVSRFGCSRTTSSLEKSKQKMALKHAVL